MGVSPLFPPQLQDNQAAQAELHHVVQRPPSSFDLQRSRWWLGGIRKAVPWLKDCSLAGVWRILQRYGLHYKRGRRYVHSPDAEYDSKLQLISEAIAKARAAPSRIIFLYEDELSYYRNPSVAQDWQPKCTDEPHAVQAAGYNSYRRIASCLNIVDGQLFSWQRSRFDAGTFGRYLLAVAQHYKEAETIYVALDNWPTHFAEQVQQAIAASKLVLLRLPTYAPWTNPVEKVWRKLKQELLHLHRYSSAWAELPQQVEEWLEQFAKGSTALLHYVGLHPY